MPTPSRQRDSDLAQLAQEKRELAETPEAELTELIALYEAKGLSPATARTVADDLTAHDQLAAHLDAELHIDPDDLPSPSRPPPHRGCRSPPGPYCPCWPSCFRRPPSGYPSPSSPSWSLSA